MEFGTVNRVGAYLFFVINVIIIGCQPTLHNPPNLKKKNLKTVLYETHAHVTDMIEMARYTPICIIILSFSSS